MVVPHGKATEPCNVLRQTAINDGGSGRGRCKIAVDPRETPCRRTVPQVLNGWIVVDVQTVNQFLAAQLRLIRVTDICIIHAEMVVLSVVSHLKKAADVAGPGTDRKS